MKIIHTDRSRAEVYLHCNRERFLRYHESGFGLAPARTPLPLAVGGAVHRGLETMLRSAQALVSRNPSYSVDEISHITSWREIEEDAVKAAISDLAQYRNALALDANETAEQSQAVETTADAMQKMAADLGLPLDSHEMQELGAVRSRSAAEFDEWLWQEQSGLVEGMVRAYARRRLRPLLEEFEVLEVEREGSWELARWMTEKDSYDAKCGDWSEAARDAWTYQLIFMSRPDALLRSRADNSLYLLSYKTAASWDRRKELDAQHDAQGLSEGVEVERRLGEAWAYLHRGVVVHQSEIDRLGINNATAEFLQNIHAAPRILGIRYEYLFKGERWTSDSLSQRFGFTCREQKSHLIRRYVCVSQPQRSKGPVPDLGAACWSYDYLREDGSESKLAWQNWKPRSIFEDSLTVKQWIDLLDQSEEAMSGYDSTTGIEPRSLGWKSAGQALGFTSQHPLDAVFHPPITIYRNDDELRDWLEQLEAQEVRIVEGVAAVDAAADADERRSLLNRHFPQTRRACSYPVQCDMLAVCFGGEDIKADPKGSGRYKDREPHHSPEREATAHASKA